MSLLGHGLFVRAQSLLLAFLLSVVLTGCGGNKDESSVAHNSAAQLSQCESDTKQAVIANTEKQMNFYRQYGSTLPKPAHQAGFFPGTNGRAIVLVHGFISSPESMNELAASLNSAGYTVITPLLTGFGDGPDAANAADKGDWEMAVNDAIQIAGLCHPDVTVVAHSLGTSVVTLGLKDGRDSNVSRVVLLAPFFKTHTKWMDWISGILAIGSDTIYLSTVEKYLGIDAYEMFDLERPKEGELDPYLPVKAMREVISLQNVFGTMSEQKIKVPVMAFITEADAIVDGKFATTYLSNHFERSQFVVYPENEKIEHSFQTRKVNPNYDLMVTQILAFVAGDASVKAAAAAK